MMRREASGTWDTVSVRFGLEREAPGQTAHRLAMSDDTYRAGNSGEYVIGLGGDDFIAGG